MRVRDLALPVLGVMSLQRFLVFRRFASSYAQHVEAETAHAGRKNTITLIGAPSEDPLSDDRHLEANIALRGTSRHRPVHS